MQLPILVMFDPIRFTWPFSISSDYIKIDSHPISKRNDQSKCSGILLAITKVGSLFPVINEKSVYEM
jgi:hypothetical protein